jgi:Flp pilus assembly protein TadD
MFVGVATIYLGRCEKAIVWLRRSVEANRNNPLSHVFLAARSAVLGRMDEARAAARAGIALDPQLTIGRFRAVIGRGDPLLFRWPRYLDG